MLGVEFVGTYFQFLDCFLVGDSILFKRWKVTICKFLRNVTVKNLAGNNCSTYLIQCI